MKLKNIIKGLTPPLVFSLLRKASRSFGSNGIIPNKGKFVGNYSTFEEAARHAKGYGDEAIVNKVRDALLQVKNETGKYERDSILFDKIYYDWPLLAIFQHVAVQNDLRLSVVDFGGSLGSTYFQNIHFLKHLNSLQWKVVEQKSFVENGRQYFEDKNLRFFHTIEEALEIQPTNILLFSGVCQYLPKPYDVLDFALSLGIQNLVFDRTCFIRDKADRITLQLVPSAMYSGSYPCTFFNEEQFLRRISEKYELIADFDSYADVGIYLQDGKKVYWKGFYFKLKP
ncbi:methyltransferase, TIGR04325 family [Flavitalea antarctica]